MIPLAILNALKKICRLVEGHNIRWVLGGGASLALQGVDITPHDIDIITEKDGAYRFNQLLKEYEVVPVRFKRSDLFESHFGQFCVDDVNVDIMGDLREKHGTKWVSLANRFETVIMLEVEEHVVPISPLIEQLKSYEKLGRTKDAHKIQKIRDAIRRNASNSV